MERINISWVSRVSIGVSVSPHTRIMSEHCITNLTNPTNYTANRITLSRVESKNLYTLVYKPTFPMEISK